MQYRLTIDVFCHAEQTSASAKALAEQRAFTRCKIAVRDGGLARAVTHYADHPSPHLIIVEDDGDTGTLQSRLDALAQVVEPGRKLIVVGAVNDISVYRRIVDRLAGHGHFQGPLALGVIGVKKFVEPLGVRRTRLAGIERAHVEPRRLAFDGGRVGVVGVMLRDIGLAGADEHSDETGTGATPQGIGHSWSPQLMM
jgi:hypothetical protein